MLYIATEKANIDEMQHKMVCEANTHDYLNVWLLNLTYSPQGIDFQEIVLKEL